MSDSQMSRPRRLLIIEDDQAFAKRLALNLQREGFEVESAASGPEAIERLRATFFDLVVTDIKMPGMSGIDVLRAIRSGDEEGVDADMPVVALSSVNLAETAVEAMKLGAADYITKEAEKSEVVVRLRRVLEQSRLANENRLLRAQLERRDLFPEIIGQSETMRRIKREIQNVGPSGALVLITGETGVGKELVARALHRASPRADGPFLDVNCAALPDENFFQSELFGHERGAFTGAASQRKGRFELAAGGTLFLDEIAEMSRESQGKILKAIEQIEIIRLGGSRPIRIDCRIICATNTDLAAEVREGRFREDLFYRVNVIPIFVPALRDRPDDIALLMDHFLEQIALRHRRPARRLGLGTEGILRSYPWPGNVRELRNVAERLTFRGGEEIGPEDLRVCGLGGASEPGGVSIPEQGVDLDEVERQYVLAALRKADWSQKDAARLLNISVDRMNARVKKFQIRHASWRTNR
jgi:DNA-binding NtrC family response regulator